MLAQHHLATALIDLSDGVASDLYQICLQSKVGAVVEAAQVPIPPAVCEVATQTGKEPLDLALKGGEDYHLLFTASPGKKQDIQKCFRQANLPTPTLYRKNCSRGWSQTAMAGQRSVEISGAGFDHFSKTSAQVSELRLGVIFMNKIIFSFRMTL